MEIQPRGSYRVESAKKVKRQVDDNLDDSRDETPVMNPRGSVKPGQTLNSLMGDDSHASHPPRPRKEPKDKIQKLLGYGQEPTAFADLARTKFLSPNRDIG